MYSTFTIMIITRDGLTKKKLLFFWILSKLPHHCPAVLTIIAGQGRAARVFYGRGGAFLILSPAVPSRRVSPLHQMGGAGRPTLPTVY